MGRNRVARRLTNESIAAPSRIFTSRSSNCWRTSFHKGVPSSLSSSFMPNSSRSLATLEDVSPSLGCVPWAANTSSGVFAHDAIGLTARECADRVRRWRTAMSRSIDTSHVCGFNPCRSPSLAEAAPSLNQTVNVYYGHGVPPTYCGRQAQQQQEVGGIVTHRTWGDQSPRRGPHPKE